jgi:addiction module HigA family antidote
MPSKPIHPGEILKDEIEILEMSASALARAIHVPANRISQILSGRRNISADTAMRLGKLFSTGPQFWLNLQVIYELDVAQACNDAYLNDIVPLSEIAVYAVP